MADEFYSGAFQLSACRELLDAYPESLCKTILTDRSVPVDGAWKAPKLVSEAMKYLNLGPSEDGGVDAKLRNGTESLVRGLNQIITGVVEIRNAHGSAAHGADAYEPLLDSRYAQILARATDAVVGLLFKTHLRSAHHDPLSRFRYGDHPEFDEYIDNDYGPFEVLGASLLASEALYRIDFQAYRVALVEFHQEQKAAPADDEQVRISE